jgi:putative heme-binding domain-containing protein
VWRATARADKQLEIEKYRAIYRAGGSQPGDALRGRVVFTKICHQCHTLFDSGGKVGPDLTGSNRGDLDYILQNIVDPNAVIPNDYRASTIETKDGRVLTCIVKEQNEKSLTVATANETVTLARNEIDSVQQSQLSMMPEALLAPLQDQEVRDLIYYLRSPSQAQLLGTSDTVGLFFNGKDLSNWDGDTELWKVENGEIVGKTEAGPETQRVFEKPARAQRFPSRVQNEAHSQPGEQRHSVSQRTVWRIRDERLPGRRGRGLVGQTLRREWAHAALEQIWRRVREDQ